MSPGATVPESTSERLARVEASRDEHREQLKVLTPLVSQYAVLEERLGNFGGDLNEGLSAIRTEIAESKADTAKQFEKIERRFDNIEADQKSRAKERRTTVVTAIVAGIGLVGTFLAQLLQNGHHP